MTEVEVEVELEDENDITIGFKFLTIGQKLRTIIVVLLGGKLTFLDVPVCASGTTTVDIDPPERY